MHNENIISMLIEFVSLGPHSIYYPGAYKIVIRSCKGWNIDVSYIKFSTQDAFLEYPSPGTFKIE